MGKNTVKGLLSPIIVLILAAFSLLSFSRTEYNFQALVVGGGFCVVILAHYNICRKLFRGVDLHLLVIVYALVSLGAVMQYRISPESGLTHIVYIAAGMTAMLLVMAFMRDLTAWKKLTWLMMLGSLGLLAVTLIVGKSTFGAKNWIDLGGFSLQPSEFIKLALVLCSAKFLSERQRLLSLWPLLAFVVGCLGLLALARDLGAALIYGLTFIVMYFSATGNWAVTGAGLGLGCAGAYAGFMLFDHVKVRVAAWKNPWASYDTSGYQIAQGLMAIASGGLFGLGLSCGTPKLIPAFKSDYIFAVICEEMGIVVGLCVIALFLLLLLRAIAISASSNRVYNALVAVGLCAVFAFQTFMIIGGVIKLIPLTGVTLPFVSAGGSSMLASFLMVGVLQAVAVQTHREVQ